MELDPLRRVAGCVWPVEEADAVNRRRPSQRLEGLVGGWHQAFAIDERVACIAHHLLQRRRRPLGRIAVSGALAFSP